MAMQRTESVHQLPATSRTVQKNLLSTVLNSFADSRKQFLETLLYGKA